MVDKKEIGALQNEVKEAASGLLDVTLYCQIAGAIVILTGIVLSLVLKPVWDLVLLSAVSVSHFSM